MRRRQLIKSLLAGAVVAAGAHLPAFATVEVAGAKFDDIATVAGKELKLNGAGLRTKVIFKVYAAGLYLAEKKNTVPDVLGATGPRRVSIIMLRDVTSDDFGKSFMEGLSSNTCLLYTSPSPRDS